MNVTIIGLGLIGGSIAKDLRTQLCVSVYGVDASTEHQDQAIRLGLVQSCVSLKEGIRQADVVILATPVDVIEDLLPQVLDITDEHTTVIDTGSTKASICHKIRGHKNRGRFVAAHPLAGTEFSGPKAAIKGLYQGKKNIICDKDLSDDDSLETALMVFKSLGMNSFFMDSIEHDKHMAYVSHLSHVTSFTLGLTVLDIEKDEKQIFNLAGTGFESTARLAKSNPETWTAIFDKNNKYIVEALDGYITQLQRFRTAIKDQDQHTMKSMMADANRIKKVLKREEQL